MESQEDKLQRAPEQVKQVYLEMVENAKSASQLADVVYLGYDGPFVPWCSRNYEEWRIGDNYERNPFSLVFRPDLNAWFYRSQQDGTDTTMAGGFDEAMGNASCWYTG